MQNLGYKAVHLIGFCFVKYTKGLKEIHHNIIMGRWNDE